MGDLGGTYARFALAEGQSGAFTHAVTYESRQFGSPEAAIQAYLKHTNCAAPGAICLAVAAPVVGQSARFLNSEWVVDGPALSQGFGGAPVRLVNDFHAIAHAIPALVPDHVEQIGARQPWLPETGDFTVGLIGPGTGLGVSGVLRVDGRLKALDSEGGHQGFAPESERQFEVLKSLRMQYERVSDERLLSGSGIENIYRALQDQCGETPASRGAAEIFQLGVDHREDAATEAVDMFFEILGQVAGNLALTLGARNGIYVAGGIARRYPKCLQRGAFRAGFENKGRHRSLMEQIPTGLITHPDPGLVGAAILARDLSPG